MDDESATITFTQVCHTCRISEEALIELLEHGLLRGIDASSKKAVFKPQMIHRIRSARRLQDDLGVNLPGVVLALELRDELERVRRELDILRRHFEGRLDFE